jgi:hypothetical protein
MAGVGEGGVIYPPSRVQGEDLGRDGIIPLTIDAASKAAVTFHH